MNDFFTGSAEIVPLTHDVPGVGAAGSYLTRAPGHERFPCAVIDWKSSDIIPLARENLKWVDGRQSAGDDGTLRVLRRSFLRAI